MTSKYESVTAAQMENLKLAISQANGPGRGQYLISKKPACVLAQLAVMEGFTVADLKWWDNANAKTGALYADILASGQSPLSKYPDMLLKRLQRIWDSAKDADTGRAAMLAEVKRSVRVRN